MERPYPASKSLFPTYTENEKNVIIVNNKDMQKRGLYDKNQDLIAVT